MTERGLALDPRPVAAASEVLGDTAPGVPERAETTWNIVGGGAALGARIEGMDLARAIVARGLSRDRAGAGPLLASSCFPRQQLDAAGT